MYGELATFKSMTWFAKPQPRLLGQSNRVRFASYSRDRDHGTGSSIQDQQCKTADNNGGVTENCDQDMNG
ncbi:hypothetical protein Bca52824_080567 [Brassica carinata]|uniref:Uncharacterized protein n=1 Tax=Brassica carinata TaxID=52824 RepID=A0A8X7TSC8_BRACI|nr:hypothetical protein Bca52824_080567 [Brassica carinata]